MKPENLLLVLGVVALMMGSCGLMSAGRTEGFTLKAFEYGEHHGWWVALALLPLSVMLIVASWVAFKNRVHL